MAKTKTTAPRSRRRGTNGSETRKESLAKKIAVFCQEYVATNNGLEAAKKAGYKSAGAAVRASELLAKPEVQAQVAVLREVVATKAGITAQKVLEEHWLIHTADPRDLMDIRRECCRYCYGKDGRYQRTPREMQEFRRDYDTNTFVKAKAKGLSLDEMAELEPFDNEGGIGFDPRKPPVESCPECFGRGVVTAYPKDLRDLSPHALKLLAGVEMTDKGIKIHRRDQDGSLKAAGCVVGAYRDGTGGGRKPEQTPSDADRMLDAIFGGTSGGGVVPATARKK